MARGTLSRDAIVAGAIELADCDGLEAVTIRRLAQHHNVTPMALYWHFEDKDKILDGIAEHLLADIDIPPLTDDPWRDQLKALMEAVLAGLRPHPNVADLVSTRVLESDAGLAIAERTLELLQRGGLPEDTAPEISGYLFASLVGMVTVEPGRRFGADPDERDDAIRVRTASLLALSPRKYPNVVRAGSRLFASASPDAYYRLGVEMLVTGLIGVATHLNAPPASERSPR
jgi:TetR/AcrR family transcriptional regulator, tetracycline repressor protein